VVVTAVVGAVLWRLKAAATPMITTITTITTEIMIDLEGNQIQRKARNRWGFKS